MGRKKNPYLALFTRDILSSPRCRALSTNAAGVYFFLLCRMNEPPTPGAYRLSDWEAHPTWLRSKTQQCLATADKYERLQYFASLLAKNDLPWRQKDILAGLQELYRYGVVTVEDDMLIQPRMYKDNGYTLSDTDGDSLVYSSPDNNEDTAENGAKKGTEKVHKKSTLSHAHATRGEVEYEIERENNIDNNSNKGGVGENARNDEDPLFNKFWTMYDKRPTFKAGRQYCVRQWYALTPDERQKALDFLPRYVAATPVRQYRMSPATYLTHKAWRKVIIRDGAVIQGINSKGELIPAMVKTPENTPKRTETPRGGVLGSQTDNSSTEKKKRAQKSKKQKVSIADNPPTLEDVQGYFAERQAQGKPFLYITAEGFYDACCQSGWTLKDGKPMVDWRARCRTFENFRKEHGDRPINSVQKSPQRPTADVNPKHVDEDNFDGMEKW